MFDLIVAGAGMGGLVAAVHARERGASVLVLEKGDRAGGSMLLSSGFLWRYREFDRFREECPGGDPGLQWLVHDRLDSDLAWLESVAGPALERETGNPLTTGLRFDPGQVTRALVEGAGEILLGEPLRRLPTETPVLLATGGFQGNRELVRRHITPEAESLWLRANPWSTGDGLTLALERGAELSSGMDEFYGRNLPAPPARVTPEGFRPLAQRYAHHAVVENARGERYAARTWSEIDVVQWTARQPDARARYTVSEERLGERVRDRTIGEMIESAEQAGGTVERAEGNVSIEVAAGITTTLGGLRVDSRWRAAERVYACGMDAGGVSTGGYSSGLAWALVSGRLAADAALAG